MESRQDYDENAWELGEKQYYKVKKHLAGCIGSGRIAPGIKARCFSLTLGINH